MTWPHRTAAWPPSPYPGSAGTRHRLTYPAPAQHSTDSNLSAILGIKPMKPSRRALGKIFTYLGLFLTGVALIGIMGPHMELQRSGRLTAQVLGNDIGYRQPGMFAFRLQLKWTTADGEQRTNITTPVRAASEEQARKAYRGRHLVAGQTYEFYTDPENPDRIQPFKGYNWTTFGTFLLLSVAGIAVFFTGMTIVRKDKTEGQAKLVKPR